MSTIQPQDVTATIKADDYVTAFDGPANEAYRAKRHAEGLELARKGAIIYISATGSWSARIPSLFGMGGYAHLQAYERLGYHAGTAALIQGWLDGGATIMDYRPAFGR